MSPACSCARVGLVATALMCAVGCRVSCEHREGDYPDPANWMVDMRDWGLVGKNHYPYLR